MKSITEILLICILVIIAFGQFSFADEAPNLYDVNKANLRKQRERRWITYYQMQRCCPQYRYQRECNEENKTSSEKVRAGDCDILWEED